MTEFAFYKTSNFRVDETFYVLVQKALEKNLNSVVIFETKEALKDISIMLWSKKPESFLPHSIERDNLSNDSPIYLTTREDNPNKSQIIFSPEGALVKKSKNWKLLLNKVKLHAHKKHNFKNMLMKNKKINYIRNEIKTVQGDKERALGRYLDRRHMVGFDLFEKQFIRLE